MKLGTQGEIETGTAHKIVPNKMPSINYFPIFASRCSDVSSAVFRLTATTRYNTTRDTNVTTIPTRLLSDDTRLSAPVSSHGLVTVYLTAV